MKIIPVEFEVKFDTLAIISFDLLSDNDERISTFHLGYEAIDGDYQFFNKYGSKIALSNIQWPAVSTELGRKIEDFDFKNGLC